MHPNEIPGLENEIYELRATVKARDAEITRLLKNNEWVRRMYETEREKVEHYYNHLCTRGLDAKYTILPRSGHAVPVVNIEKLGELMDRADAAEARVREMEDMFNRRANAALEDLRRIAELEAQLAEAKEW